MAVMVIEMVTEGGVLLLPIIGREGIETGLRYFKKSATAHLHSLPFISPRPLFSNQ